jgi:hypothetical protein
LGLFTVHKAYYLLVGCLGTLREVSGRPGHQSERLHNDPKRCASLDPIICCCLELAGFGAQHHHAGPADSTAI